MRQLPDSARLVGGQAGQDVLQIDIGIVPVHTGRLDQAHDRRSPLAGAQRTRKEPVLATDGNRPDLVLDPVVMCALQRHG